MCVRGHVGTHVWIFAHACNGAAIFLAVGVGVGMKYFKDMAPKVDPDWSLGLAATGCGLYFVAAIVSAVSMRVAMTVA